MMKRKRNNKKTQMNPIVRRMQKIKRLYKRNKSTIHKVTALVVGVILLGILIEVNPKVRRARSPRSLDRYTNRTTHAVVMFQNKDKKVLKQNRQLKKRIAKQENMFNQIGKRYRYKEGDVTFVRVNSAREKMQSVPAEYNISSYPSFVVFKHGEPIATLANKNSFFNGQVTADKLESFIESNIGASIDTVIKDKKKERERRLQEARIRSYYRPYWGWGWGGGYYWHRPYWGWRWGGYWW